MADNENDSLDALRAELRTWLAKGQQLEARLSALEAQHASTSDPQDALIPTDPEVLPAAPPVPIEAPVRVVTPPPLPRRLSLPDTPEDTDTTPIPPVPSPLPPSGPGLDDLIWGYLRKLGPKEPMTWEMALGTYWLPRAAVLVLGIGVVWLMGFAINRFADAWWMPHLRIAIGAVLSVALLAWGKREEAKRPGFARVLLSGGFGLSYFVAFATHFVPFSRIIPSPQPTLVLLSGLVAVWLVLAHRRRSRLLALGVVALGHATVALSTLTLAQPTPWAILGLLSLSSASGFFLARHRWFTVAAAGLAGSYCNHFFWLAKSPGSDAPLDFIVAMAILVAYGLIFAVAEFLAPESLRRRGVALRWRTAYVAANSTAVLLLGIGLMHSFPFSKPHLHVFYFLFSGALCAMGWAYRTKRAEDPLFGAYFTKASVVFTLGLAAYFHGASLTLSLALEAVALLEAARRSGQLLTRLLALGALGITLMQGFAFVVDAAPVAYGVPGHLGLSVSAALSVAALLAFALRWQQAAWSGPDLALAYGPRWFKAWLWSLGCGTLAPAPRPARPMAGLLVSELAAVAAALLGLALLSLLAANQDAATLASGAALIAALAAVTWGARPLVHASWLWTAAALVLWHAYAAPLQLLAYTSTGWTSGALNALSVLLPLLLLSELSRRANPSTWSLQSPVARAVPYVYAGLAVEVATLASSGLMHPVHQAAVLSLVVCGALLYAALCGAAPVSVFAAALAVIAAVSMTVVPLPLTHPAWQFAAMLALAAAAVATDRNVSGDHKGLCLVHSPLGRYVLYLVAAWAVVMFGSTYFEAVLGAPLLLAAALLTAAAMLRLTPQPICAAATLVAVSAAALWFAGYNLSESHQLHPMLWHAGSVFLVLGLAGLDRWFARQRAFPRAVPGALVITAAWGTLLIYADPWVFHSNAEWTWIVAAALLVLYGVPFRARTPIVLGVLTAAATTALLLSRAADNAHNTLELVVSFGVAILFWFGIERGAARFLPRMSRIQESLRPWIEGVLTAVPCILLAIWVERMPYLGAEYLSVGWTLAAVAMLAAGVGTGQRFYRYAGLITFALVLYRLILIDSRGLDTVYRILGMIFLGLVLLGVAYGYLKARDRQT
jgi:hypothetical protein